MRDPRIDPRPGDAVGTTGPQRTDTAELRRLWEAKEASPSGLDAGLSDAECAWMDAVEQSFPALLDELEAARAELEALKIPLAIYERHTKLIGAAEELERLAQSAGSCEVMGDGAYFDGVETERREWKNELLERAAQLRKEAEGK